MSFLGRRYRFCDGSCQQGQRLHGREVLTSSISTRVTHNSPVSESDDCDDELVNYKPMNVFGEYGCNAVANPQIDKDLAQLPVTRVLEQFQLGEGDRKREQNQFLEGGENEACHFHVSGDVFHWSCEPTPNQTGVKLRDALEFMNKAKKVGIEKRYHKIKKLKGDIGKGKIEPPTQTQQQPPAPTMAQQSQGHPQLIPIHKEDIRQQLPLTNDLMIVGTSCETFTKKERNGCVLDN